MNRPSRPRSTTIRASLWLTGGAILLIYTIISAFELIQRPESLRFTKGPEQSVLIFLFAALAAIAEGVVQLGLGIPHRWPWKVLALPLLLGSFVWLLFGGPAYEPWLFSLAVGTVFVASGWQLFVRAK